MSEWLDIDTAPKDGRPVLLRDATRPWTRRTGILGRWSGAYWKRIDRHGFINMRIYATHWKPADKEQA